MGLPIGKTTLGAQLGGSLLRARRLSPSPVGTSVPPSCVRLSKAGILGVIGCFGPIKTIKVKSFFIQKLLKLPTLQISPFLSSGKKWVFWDSRRILTTILGSIMIHTFCNR